ncbi:nucleotidyltransferase family protein [Sphingomonas sp. 1P06PA]|uniref:nucleotidyltransferase family protein n=1 Tax=Sphingomonas sp. 1P06PA TaxID=554121 RepID=UPI0039A49725
MDQHLNGSGSARWTAIVLAGERPGGDPFAAASGASLKAAIRVQGVALLDHVVAALRSVPAIGDIVILAQDIDALSASDMEWTRDPRRVRLVRSGRGIAASVSAITGTAEAPWPILVTTADNALLTPDRIRAFLDQAGDTDITVGVGERAIVEQVFPQTSRTWLKFRDGHYSGANLFALRSPRASGVLAKWAKIESDRKKGLKLVASFGPLLLLRALTRTIDFADAIARAANRLGCTAKPVILDAEAPIDVDKPADLALVEQIMAARAAAAGGGRG